MLHLDVEAGGVEEAVVLPGLGQRDDGVGDAVADEHAELADLGQPQQRAAAARHAAVERDDAGEAVRVDQAEAVGDGGPLAEAGEVDPLGVDVVRPAGLLDGAEDVILDHRVVAAFRPQL